MADRGGTLVSRTDVEHLIAGMGIDRVGIASADPFPEVAAALISRRQTGLSASLGFTFSDPEGSTDLTSHFPWARSVVVLGRSYLPMAGSPVSIGGRARVARFAVEDFYVPLRAALRRIADHLRDEGARAEVLVDDPRLVDRAVAVRAGLGWWGKNTMVLAPAQGPWMLFGSVVTDVDLERTPPMHRDCGSCDACLPACPTGALISPGVLDARLCLAAVLQSPGVIPASLRGPVGDRLYGCDDCLAACPPGIKALTSADRERGSHELRWLLESDDESLEGEFGHFYLARSSVDMLRRNALVVAGNSGQPSLMPLVVGYLGHPDPILRLHAAWAARRLGPSWIERLLEDLAATESDPRVLDELGQSLVGQRGEPSGK